MWKVALKVFYSDILQWNDCILLPWKFPRKSYNFVKLQVSVPVNLESFLFLPQKWLQGWLYGPMMAQVSKRSNASSWGLLNNHRYLCKKAMMLHAVEYAKTRMNHQQNIRRMKRKGTDNHSETQGGSKIVKRAKWRDARQESDSTDSCNAVQQLCVSQNSASVQHEAGAAHRLAAAMTEHWEVDSGFASETSPPASGRSSPCLRPCPTTIVALDCEMVGTGPRGRCSELARCSILDYHGNILYDKYVLPRQPVTDYRTRWSGIQRHHLRNATPFIQARGEVRPCVNLTSVASIFPYIFIG